MTSLILDFAFEDERRLQALESQVGKLEKLLSTRNPPDLMEHVREICLASRSVRLALVEASLFSESEEHIEKVAPVLQRVTLALEDTISHAGDNEQFVQQHIDYARRIESDTGTLLHAIRLNDHPKSHVFLSYVGENHAQALKISKFLETNGVGVWMDRFNLQPGKRWKQSIRQAIKEGQYFLALFSEDYSNRDKSYMNEELTLAIEELRQRPKDTSWFIPFLLDSCAVPCLDIGAGETLSDIHYIRFTGNWGDSLQQLLGVVRRNAK